MAKAPAARELMDGLPAFKIIVAGGFGSGKSTLINLLLEEQVLDLHVGFRKSPLLRLISSNEPEVCHVTNERGQREAVADMGEALNTPDATLVEQSAKFAALTGVEIIEFPSAEFAEIDSTHIDVIEDADLLIWCTIGSQAWRLSEKTALNRLRQKFDGRVVLAVTRSDQFQSQSDLEKVRKRLEREATEFVDEIFFLGASQALIRQAGQEGFRSQVGVDHLDNLIDELKKSSSKKYPQSGALAKVPAVSPPAEIVKIAEGQNDLAASVIPDVPKPVVGEVPASDFNDLIEPLREVAGIQTAGVLDSTAGDCLAGELPRYAAPVYEGLAALPGDDAGPMENILLTTISAHTIFHRLDQIDSAVLVVTYSRQSVVISAERSRLRTICDEWQAIESELHDT